MVYTFNINPEQPLRPSVLIVLALVSALSACTAMPVSISDARGNIAIELWVSAKCVKAGDTLTVRATVTNRDSQTHLVELKDQPVLDLVIGYHGVTGDTSIRWSDGKPLSTDLTHLELKPGESKSIEIRWVVVDPAPSTVGITARFIDDTRFTHRPLSPYMVIYGPNLCPGPFGP